MVVIRLWSWLVLGGQTPWFMLETLPPRAGERQYKGGRKTGVGVRNRESAVWCACRTDRPRPTHIYMHTALRTYVGCTHLLVRMGLLFVVLSDLQQRSLMFIRGSLRVPTPSWCKRFPTNDHNSCSHNVLVGIYVLGVITEWLYTRKRQQQYSQSTSMLSSTTINNTPQTRTVYSTDNYDSALRPLLLLGRVEKRNIRCRNRLGRTSYCCRGGAHDNIVGIKGNTRTWPFG